MLLYVDLVCYLNNATYYWVYINSPSQIKCKWSAVSDLKCHRNAFARSEITSYQITFVTGWKIDTGDSDVFVMSTVVNSPVGVWTVFDTCFIATAADFVQPDLILFVNDTVVANVHFASNVSVRSQIISVEVHQDGNVNYRQFTEMLMLTAIYNEKHAGK